MSSSYSDIVALFARYFGWSLEDIQSLSMAQLCSFQESLYKILRMENGVEENTNNVKKADAIKMEIIGDRIKKMKSKGIKKFDLFKDIGILGSK